MQSVLTILIGQSKKREKQANRLSTETEIEPTDTRSLTKIKIYGLTDC